MTTKQALGGMLRGEVLMSSNGCVAMSLDPEVVQYQHTGKQTQWIFCLQYKEPTVEAYYIHKCDCAEFIIGAEKAIQRFNELCSVPFMQPLGI